MKYRIIALFLVLLAAISFTGKDPALLGLLPLLLIFWTGIEMIACYRKKIVVEPIIFGLILANCLWWFLSVIWSESTSVTLVTYNIPISILAGYLLVTLWKSSSEKFFAHTDTVVIAFAAISALYAISQVVAGEIPQSLMANRNTHAALLNLISFILYFKILDRDTIPGNKALCYLAFVVISTAMFIAGGRGAMIAFVVSLGIILAVLYKDITWKEQLLLLGLPLSGFGFSSILGGNYSVTRIKTLETIVEYGGVSDVALIERFNIWKDSLNLIDLPHLLGHGLGTFWVLFASARDPLVTSRFWYAHNDLLQIWIEVGSIGLLLFMGLFLYISFRSIPLLISKELIYKDRISLVTIVAAIASVSIHSLVTFNFYIPIILFLIGFLIAKYQYIGIKCNKNKTVSFVPSGLFSYKGYVILTTLLMLLSSQFSATYSISSLLLKGASNDFTTGEIESGFNKLHYAGSLSPNIDFFHKRQAETLTLILKKSWNEEIFIIAQDSYKNCIDANKYRVGCYLGLANLLLLHPKPELYYSRIEQLYKESLSYDPSHPMTLADFANFYMRQDDLQSAYHILKGTEDFKMIRWQGERSYLITYYRLLEKLNKSDQIVKIRERLKRYGSLKTVR